MTEDPNQVHVGGRATQKPALRYTGGGTPVTEFTLAVHRAVVDDAGRETQETIFVSCLAYREEALRASAVIHRGSQVDVAGRLWTAPRAQGRGRELVVVVESVYAGGGVPIEIKIPAQANQGASDDAENERLWATGDEPRAGEDGGQGG